MEKPTRLCGDKSGGYLCFSLSRIEGIYSLIKKKRKSSTYRFKGCVLSFVNFLGELQ